MARRFSGNVTIQVVYCDKGDYRCRVTFGPHVVTLNVNPPVSGFGGHAYDSPEAYDEVARSALAFASTPSAVEPHEREAAEAIDMAAEFGDSAPIVTRQRRK